MIVTVTLNAAIDKRYEMKQFQVGQVNRVLGCTYAAGGKGINVARVVQLSGEEVCASGFAGGYMGEYILDNLKKSGIKTAFSAVGGENRTCINIFDSISGQQTELLEGGFTVTEEETGRLMEIYEQLLKKAEVVTLNGSVPEGTPSDIYKKMVLAAKKERVPVLLDTSGEMLQNSIEAVPDLIKPNQDEIRQLLGRYPENEEELQKSAEELRDRGISYVAISLGGDGSILASEAGTYRARVPKIETVNTVGCGDAMIAGFAMGIKRGYGPEEMLRLASAVSAASALQERTGVIDPGDVQALMSEIRIQRI